MGHRWTCYYYTCTTHLPHTPLHPYPHHTTTITPSPTLTPTLTPTSTPTPITTPITSHKHTPHSYKYTQSRSLSHTKLTTSIAYQYIQVSSDDYALTNYTMSDVSDERVS